MSESSLTTIYSGETIHIKVDVASVNDLTEGGTYSILSHGAIPCAESGSSKISSAISFKSNVLEIDVDGAEAAQISKAFSGLDKRSAVQSDCTGSDLDATLAALIVLLLSLGSVVPLTAGPQRTTALTLSTAAVTMCSPTRSRQKIW